MVDPDRPVFSFSFSPVTTDFPPSFHSYFHPPPTLGTVYPCVIQGSFSTKTFLKETFQFFYTTLFCNSTSTQNALLDFRFDSPLLYQRFCCEFTSTCGQEVYL
jgi:hypothetical protein